MIDEINITNVQKIEISGPRPREFWKSRRRVINITYGDNGDLTVIRLASDGDDVPVFVFDHAGTRHLLYDDDEENGK